jgi:hypothetical protein
MLTCERRAASRTQSEERAGLDRQADIQEEAKRDRAAKTESCTALGFALIGPRLLVKVAREERVSG